MRVSFLLILALGLSSHLSRSCLALALLRAFRVDCRTFLPSSWTSCRACSSGWRSGFLRHPVATLWPSSQPTLMRHLRSPPGLFEFRLLRSLPLSRLYVFRASVSSSSLYSLDLRLELAFYLGPVPACGAPCPVVQFVILLSAVFQLASPTRVRASRVNH